MAKPKVKVKKTFDYGKLSRMFPVLTAGMLNMKGGIIHDAIQNGIDLQQDIEGKDYTEISDNTLVRRKKRGIQGKKLLHVTGKMRQTRVKNASPTNQIHTITAITPYGAEHNEGDPSQNLPQRKWFGIPKSTRRGGPEAKKIDLMWAEALRRAWKKHG